MGHFLAQKGKRGVESEPLTPQIMLVQLPTVANFCPLFAFVSYWFPLDNEKRKALKSFKIKHF